MKRRLIVSRNKSTVSKIVRQLSGSSRGGNRIRHWKQHTTQQPNNLYIDIRSTGAVRIGKLEVILLYTRVKHGKMLKIQQDISRMPRTIDWGASMENSVYIPRQKNLSNSSSFILKCLHGEHSGEVAYLCQKEPVLPYAEQSPESPYLNDLTRYWRSKRLLMHYLCFCHHHHHNHHYLYILLGCGSIQSNG